jgi:uncharacterized protein (TIGR02594 family)
MNITAYSLAMRFAQIKEVPGKAANPQIMAMLQLDDKWPDGDEVPWCSAFMNYICWILRLPRSKKLNAQSWLEVGTAIDIESAGPGWDIVVLNRPEAGDWAGHVGFFVWLNREQQKVYLLGGNQGDTVSVASYPLDRVIGVRRLLSE